MAIYAHMRQYRSTPHIKGLCASPFKLKPRHYTDMHHMTCASCHTHEQLVVWFEQAGALNIVYVSWCSTICSDCTASPGQCSYPVLADTDAYACVVRMFIELD